MSGIGYNPPASTADVDAVKAQIPQAANTTPQQEKTGGNVGDVDMRYAKADHQHPRLTSTTYSTLASDGTATVAFTRSFVNKPGVNMTEVDSVGKQPLVCSVQSWTQDINGLYTGCVIKGQRAQLLPNMPALSGTLTLLTQVLAGVNGVIAALTQFNVFAGPASGASVSVIAVARSDVSSS